MELNAIPLFFYKNQFGNIKPQENPAGIRLFHPQMKAQKALVLFVP